MSHLHGIRSLLAVFVVVCLGGPLAGQTLVKDINVQPDSTVPGSTMFGGVSANGLAFFSTVTDSFGSEPWVSDGTPGGTRVLRDIMIGTGHSSPAEFVALPGGEVLFRATSAEEGGELWKSDGTPAGTVVVKDIVPGPVGSSPVSLTLFNGEVYFIADDGQTGRELWKSDGTAAGTVQVKDIVPGPGGITNGTHDMVASGNWLYFSALGSGFGAGWELWKTDGTPGNTQYVASITDSYLDSIYYMMDFNGQVVFRAEHPTLGQELWISNGAAAGTGLVIDLVPGIVGSGPIPMAVVGGKLLFHAAEPTYGKELFLTDGTAAGTSLLADIGPGKTDSSVYSVGMLNSEWYFNVWLNTVGYRLWKSDGTPAGTGQTSIPFEPRSAALVQNGRLHMSGYVSASGLELWSTDGTVGGSTRLTDLQPGPGHSSPNNLLAVNGGLVFSADDGVIGQEPYFNDGTPTGTVSLGDLNGPVISLSSYPWGLTPAGARVVFSADDGVIGQEPWVSDGSSGGTVPLMDVNSGPTGSSPGGFVEVHGQTFFVANDGVHGSELWVTDGRPAGTRMVADLNPGAVGSNPFHLVGLGRRVLFAANDGVLGTELWSSDGTAAGTAMLKDLAPGGPSSYPANLVEANGLIYFQANSGQFGLELHRSDGTAAGTFLVADVNPGSNNGLRWVLAGAGLGGEFIFQADDGVNGLELWKTDGTQGNATVLADLNPAGDSNPHGFAAVNGVMTFVADEGAGINQPYRTDGTSPGTQRIQFFSNGVNGLEVATDTHVYFERLFPGNLSVNLVSYDGTTMRFCGSFDGVVRYNRSAVPAGSGDVLLFHGIDAASGSELWVSQGDQASTRRVTEIAPFGEDANPAWIARAGSWLYFSANDQAHGIELHRLAVADLGAYVAQNYGEACPGTGGLVPHISTVGAATTAGFDVKLTDALPNTFAWIAVSVRRAYLDLGGGCTLYTAPPLTLIPYATDALGEASLRWKPSAQSIGLNLYFQYFPQDAGGGPLGYSATEGLEIVVGG